MSKNLGFDPRHVVAPQSQWRLVDILWESQAWSMAIGRWREENGERPVLAQRWNGPLGGKGNPTSRGHPTWFVLPDETYPLWLDSEFIPESKRNFVKEILGL